jgi:TPP-dependent pyruvate/acetoin dehydrogenase alpha subunit
MRLEVRNKVTMTPADLIAFEKEIAAEFEAGQIKAPVHLAGGNEQILIDIFKDIRPDDWVLCAWRSHYHCLLKGVPPADLKAAIHAGRSIALCFPEHRILSSAIVGGICPIATGLGWAIKERGGKERVHMFVGDMTAHTGIYHECWQYCFGHDLPVTLWTESNGKSVCTDTEEVWGKWETFANRSSRNYTYELTRPHVGTGKWVRF